MILLPFFVGFVAVSVSCDVVHLKSETKEEPQEQPSPGLYAFGYAAGRYPGNIDRIHSEVSDGTGVVKGSYSYVDPRFQIRTVDYVADKNGFHPILNKTPSPVPRDTPVVAAAKDRHLRQYAAIAAARHANPGEVIVPVDTVAVNHARQRHLALFDKIAREHAELGAQRELEKQALKEKNLLQEEEY